MPKADDYQPVTQEAPKELFVQLYRHSIVSGDIDPREVHDNGRPVYRYYSLTEIERLAREYADTIKVSDDAFMAQLILSIFVEYLRKHEQEREVGDGS